MAASKAPAENPAIIDAEEVTEAGPVVDPAPPPPGADTPVEAKPLSKAAPSPRKSRGFLGFVTGGILAAGAGFGLAKFVPDGWPIRANTTEIESSLSAQSQEIADLSAKLAELTSRPTVDQAAIIAQLTQTVDQKLATLPTISDPSPAMLALESSVDTKLAELDTRLNEVEKLPVEGGGSASTTALAAYDRELRALKEQVTALASGGLEQRTDVQALADEVKAQLVATSDEIQQLEAATAADTALGRVQSALEVGRPYAVALKAFAAVGIEVPAALSAPADTGVKSLTDLQRNFPVAARAALEASRRSDMGEGWTERLMSFFEVQTGVRSLQPREGTDTDAILSRAEDALAKGLLGDALTELAQLPEAANPAMTTWLTEAQTRLAATEAFSALTVAMDKK